MRTDAISRKSFPIKNDIEQKFGVSCAALRDFPGKSLFAVNHFINNSRLQQQVTCTVVNLLFGVMSGSDGRRLNLLPAAHVRSQNMRQYYILCERERELEHSANCKVTFVVWKFV